MDTEQVVWSLFWLLCLCCGALLRRSGTVERGTGKLESGTGKFILALVSSQAQHRNFLSQKKLQQREAEKAKFATQERVSRPLCQRLTDKPLENEVSYFMVSFAL